MKSRLLRLRGWSSERGQATVELIALAPLMVITGIAICLLLAGYAAREAADQAAVAAAVADLQGRDAKQAAREASPGWARATAQLGSGRVRVVVRPRLPASLARLVDADRTVVVEPGAQR